ncbi:MAG TPA: Fe-S cluster assembly protein SufD [Candidatus Polarisedimenticolia bacterium]|nr:Fe-S cluster assembly protein SufD [Candidatus Polarisedimenticolia bacterium]
MPKPNPSFDVRQHYAEQFSKAGNGSKDPGWLGTLRQAGLDSFAAKGFPTLDDEDWKYTSVAPIAKTPFETGEASKVEGLTVGQLQQLTFGEMECTHLVFVNGHFAPALSRRRPLPDGVRAGGLAEALGEAPGKVLGHLGRHALPQDNPFVALNTAFIHDGAFVHLPRRKVLQEPIHLIFVAIPNGQPMVSHPRNLIVAEEGSQAAVVESYISLHPQAYFTNAVTEVVAGEGTVLDHCKLQRESEPAYHVATLQAHLGRGARFSSHAVSLGAALARNDLNMVLDAEGVECVLNGLYLAHGDQHVDNHTFIDHAKPHCSSRELYKGVLAGRSHGVFNGKIRVREDAQKTDSKQTNKNLLLSEEALVDTKPQLEIYADDVKCTHGATIGQLDEDALFYLRSRGLEEGDARSLLIHAFATDLLERIPVKPVRTGLECLLMTRLPMRAGHKEKP